MFYLILSYLMNVDNTMFFIWFLEFTYCFILLKYVTISFSQNSKLSPYLNEPFEETHFILSHDTITVYQWTSSLGDCFCLYLQKIPQSFVAPDELMRYNVKPNVCACFSFGSSVKKEKKGKGLCHILFDVIFKKDIPTVLELPCSTVI